MKVNFLTSIVFQLRNTKIAHSGIIFKLLETPKIPDRLPMLR
jgi:hypothetical protein